MIGSGNNGLGILECSSFNKNLQFASYYGKEQLKRKKSLMWGKHKIVKNKLNFKFKKRYNYNL